MKKLVTLSLAALLVAAWTVSAFASEVGGCSARNEHLIKPLLEAHTAPALKSIALPAREEPCLSDSRQEATVPPPT